MAMRRRVWQGTLRSRWNERGTLRSPEPPAPRLGREAGVTLIELLIAVALLGFILLGIAPLFLASVKSNYSAEQYTSIHNIARDRLEVLLNLPFDDPQLFPGTYGTSDLPPTLPDPHTAVPPVTGVPNPYQLTYAVQQWQIPSDDPGVTPNGAVYTPIPINAAGALFDYKEIIVTVLTPQGVLGIGSRVTRVSGCRENPTPRVANSRAPGVY